VRDQAIALAGMAQAAFLVDQLARTGVLDRDIARPCVESLFKFDAVSAEDVYGGLGNLRVGIAVLTTLLDRKLDRQRQDQLRYLSGMIHLQRRLRARDDMLQVVRNRLEHIARHGTHFSSDPSQVVAAIAGLYQDTISTFPYRIQVTGEPRYLQQDANANRIRTLLLAGIRGATLWQQCGGRRWLLMFQRRSLLRQLGILSAGMPPN